MRVLLSIALLLACAGCEIVDDKQPEPAADFPSLVHETMVTRSHSLAEVARDTANRVESGELKDSRQMLDFFHQGADQVREKSDKAIGEYWDRYNGGDNYSNEKAVILLREQAEGYDRVR